MICRVRCPLGAKAYAARRPTRGDNAAQRNPRPTKRPNRGPLWANFPTRGPCDPPSWAAREPVRHRRGRDHSCFGTPRFPGDRSIQIGAPSGRLLPSGLRRYGGHWNPAESPRKGSALRLRTLSLQDAFRRFRTDEAQTHRDARHPCRRGFHPRRTNPQVRWTSRGHCPR